MSCIRSDPRTRINTNLQSHPVYFIGQCFHIRKFTIRHHSLMFTTSQSLPAIININVLPAMVNQPFFHHSPRRTKHLLLTNCISPAVPAVPPHRWGQSYFISNNNTERTFSLTQIILCHKCHHILTCFFYGPPDLSGFGIHL